jgi:hypothetical protein
MSAFVLDTNVLVTANFRASHASAACVTASVAMLIEVRQQHVVVIDDAMIIFHEYFRRASLRGQPGVGDAFLKWLWDNQAKAEHCEKVRITPLADDPDDYREFPRDPGLERFDRNDRKFVAVALVSASKPEVVNSVDTGWHTYREALSRHGVAVRFLCPEQMTERRRHREPR